MAEQKDVRTLTKKELNKLLVVARESTELSSYPNRDYILIKMTYLHALRNSEAVSLRRRDINLHEGYILVKDGKGGKDARVRIHSNIRDEVEEYLQKFDTEEHIFPSRVSSTHLTPRGFQYLISKYAMDAGLYPEHIDFGDLENLPYEERVFPHSLRHSLSYHLLKQGTPMQEVKKILRHEKIKTTIDIYGHLTMEDVAESHEQVSI